MTICILHPLYMTYSIVTLILYIRGLFRSGFFMFVRNERSVKEFIQLYPVVTVIVIINFVLCGMYKVLGLEIVFAIYNWGLAHNPFVTAGDYHRLITPMFLHADFTHVAFI